MKKFFKLLGPKLTAILFLCLMLLIIGLQNLEPANVRVLFWTFLEVPKLYLLFFSFLAGLIAGFALGTLPMPADKPKSITETKPKTSTP